MACNIGTVACGWTIKPTKPSCLCYSDLQCLNNALDNLIGINANILSILGTSTTANGTEYLVLARVIPQILPPTEELVVYEILQTNNQCTIINAVTICSVE